ncbi:MAG: Gfo/Idh/MocA family oxidoreductase [Rhodobacteraceae bacterium]|nr:Gfo/Idh/MocA family oxidoreductase [Paracoccaceae bacterium]
MKTGALIGCGFFAENHLHAWRDVAGAEISAICDRDPERLRIVGEMFGIDRRYADAEQMLTDGSFDFVDIATTVASHRPLVELVAQSGAHIICQKPFADSMTDARAMVAAANAAGLSLMVHENFRWQSAIRAAKALIDDGSIGEPFWGRVSFRSAYDVYAAQPYLATDDKFIIQDLGIHLLDIARFLFGDVAALSASTRRVNPKIRAEDVATMLLHHKSGLASMVDCSYATQLPEESFPQTLLEIDGEKGTLRLSVGYRLTLTDQQGTREIDVSPPLLPWAERPWHNIQESVFAIQQHFVEQLEKGGVTETSGADNLKTLELVYGAYESAADHGKSVTLE